MIAIAPRRWQEFTPYLGCLKPSPQHMSGTSRLFRFAVALAAAGSLALAGCSATRQAASDVGGAAKTAASGVGDTAKTMATAAGQAALAAALNPLLELLSKGQAELKAGNVGAAVTAMGGFQGLWDKAGPVIQPLAGEKWAAIDSAAKTVISTFGSGAKPDAAAAGSAISGLIGPLKALAGN